MPVNTKIWVSGMSSCSIQHRLFTESGDEVETTQTCITQGFASEFAVLHPQQALLPNQRYMIDMELDGFRTGSNGAQSPAKPEVEDINIERDKSCDDIFYRAEYTLGPTELSRTGVIFLLDANEESQLDLADLSGFVTAFNGSATLTLGAGECLGDNFPGGASSGATASVRFASIDITGEFSGWTDPDEVSLSGCNSANTPVPYFWVLVPLLRRRRLFCT